MIRSSWKELLPWCEGVAALGTLPSTSAALAAPSRQRSAPSGLGEAGIPSRSSPGGKELGAGQSSL